MLHMIKSIFQLYMTLTYFFEAVFFVDKLTIKRLSIYGSLYISIWNSY